MKHLHYLILLVIFLTTLFLIGSCNLFNKESNKPEIPILNPPQVTLAVPDETTVVITGGEAPFRLSGGNASIASVTVHGNAIDIKALKVGTSVVTVQGSDDGTTELIVTVTEELPAPAPQLTPSQVTLAVLEETAVAITDGKAPFQLSGGNASIASVTIHGNAIDIKALKAGTSIVTVQGSDGGAAELVITVTDTPLTAPQLTPSTVEIREGEVATVEISNGVAPYRLLGGNALVASVTVNFNFITIKGIKEGDTYVQVTGADGASSILTIHVLGDDLVKEEEDKYREYISPELENSLKNRLKMNIHRGTNPPNITGYYRMEQFCTQSTISGDSYIGRTINDYILKFYSQMGIEINFEGYEVRQGTYEADAFHLGTGSFICGTGNNFTLFFNETTQLSEGPDCIMVTVFSGEIVKDNQGRIIGFKNFQEAILMRDNGGRTDVIDNGEGRLFEDDFVEVITKEEYEKINNSSVVKSATTHNNLHTMMRK